MLSSICFAILFAFRAWFISVSAGFTFLASIDVSIATWLNVSRQITVSTEVIMRVGGHTYDP